MSYRNRGSRTRSRVTLVGAVGAIGFAVYYFLDPELGPRRRRDVLEAVHDAAAGAWRLSQDLVSRLVEPPEDEAGPAAPPPVAARAREVTVERRVVQHAPDPDLASTLHDEVSFFRVGEDSRLHEAGPVALVTASAAEPLHLAEATVHEDRTYPATPEPRIIAYDATDSTFDDEVPVAAEEPVGDGRSTRRGLLAVAAVAALLVAAAVLGGWAVWGGDDSSPSATASPGAAQAIELISQPGARRVAVNGSRGTMVLLTTPDGRAVLILYGLKQAPAGKEYQAWIVRGKTPSSAGLFKGGGTTVVIPLAQRVPKGAIFAVTLEQAGGVPAPTQAPQYTAKLS